MADDTLAYRSQNATRTEAVHLPPTAAPTNHGHTTAAWTTTIVVVLGAVVAALGLVFALAWLAWTSLAYASAASLCWYLSRRWHETHGPV